MSLQPNDRESQLDVEPMTESGDSQKRDVDISHNLLAIALALISLVVTGGILFVIVQIMESMESPGNRFPEWVAKFTVIIAVGIFIALWKLGLAFLVQRFRNKA